MDPEIANSQEDSDIAELMDDTVTDRRARHETVGRLLLGFGLALIVARGLETAIGFPGLPRTWYQNDWLWWLVGLTALGAGARLLFRVENQAPTDGWSPTKPGRRFQRLVLYTRDGCHLCDEAAQTLKKYGKWLPPAEQVDIDADPELRSQFDTCVPVISTDGRIRFRGRVNEVLLRRLIEGTPPAS